MESNSNGSNMDFGFAFNVIEFSDRVLRIEIEQDDKDNELCEECGIEVKSIHISSPILAAKTPFFFNLFSNGMKESLESLRIHSSQEVALMELLKFMYTNTLSSTTTSSLLDVLMVAEKFQVSSCITYCTQLLLKLPMTRKSALLFLDLPSSVVLVDGFQPLTDAAKRYLADLYKGFTESEEELLKLPLAGIEAVLSSDNLKVASEDDVYEFVVKWSRKHYPIIEKRREIITTKLGCLIHFKYTTRSMLKDILACNDFDPAYASKVVLEALFFKSKSSQVHTFNPSRAYTYRPVKVLGSKFPHPHCVVYLDLKKEECANLLSSDHVTSESFKLGGKWFYLFAQRCTPVNSFGLFLALEKNEAGSCSVAYEFSARSKPAEEFERKGKVTYTLTSKDAYDFSNLFGVSWSEFIAEESVYFINGVLYLKAEITIK